MIEANIILGSASPRRLALLSSIVTSDIEVITADIDESIDDYSSSYEIASLLAKAKMEAILKKKPISDKLVITADTVVILDDILLGKPSDKQEAITMLQSLQNNQHSVITGVCIASKEKKTSFSEITEVFFDKLSDDEIEYYVENYKPYDKAGAYGIQEWIGKIGIKKIEGCYYNVMGLPLHSLYNALLSI